MRVEVFIKDPDEPCIQCDGVLRHLTAKGVTFTPAFISQNLAALQLAQNHNVKSAPIVKVTHKNEVKVFGGFDVTKIEDIILIPLGLMPPKVQAQDSQSQAA